jgi:hypothetical protein
MSYTGRCACGGVRLSISGEPVAIRQCWCRQCQKLCGGGPSHNAMFHTHDVAIDGELATHSYLADSGNTLTQWFCATCGNPVYAQSSARPQFRTVRIGVIDEPHGIAPRMAIWTEAAPAWAAIDPRLDQFPRQPPPPAGSK